MPFAKGPDPNRHQFSRAECRRGGRRGFARIMRDKPWLLLWLKKRISAFYKKGECQRA